MNGIALTFGCVVVLGLSTGCAVAVPEVATTRPKQVPVKRLW